LIGKVNGNPIRTIYVFSRPEWTALVTMPDSPIKNVADLKGQRVAVTRGTDPHIFLVRALATAGLSEKDVKLVLLQHPDGRTALERGDVAAWAGLDPMMAAAELESHARLFYRNPGANTWGVLNVREAFAAAHPDSVRKLLTQYEVARKWAIDHKPELITLMGAADKLSAEVNERQLERTDLSSGMIGDNQATTIIEAGKALQAAGVPDPSVDVTAVTRGMIDASYARAIGA
jgi:sulfonate transport system substrate-binding protein